LLRGDAAISSVAGTRHREEADDEKERSPSFFDLQSCKVAVFASVYE